MRRLVPILPVLLLLGGCATPAPAAVQTAATPSAAASTPATKPAATAPVASPTPPAPTLEAKTVSIKLANGKGEPNAERVELARGEHLVLSITTDRDDQIHVHGFDLEIPVKAGKQVRKELVADRVGRFEVESHHPVLTLLVLQVR